MKLLDIIQVVLALLLAASVLIQQQGTGIGGAFGGEGNVYRSRRGIEKFLFQATIILAISFFAVALIAFIKNK